MLPLKQLLIIIIVTTDNAGDILVEKYVTGKHRTTLLPQNGIMYLYLYIFFFMLSVNILLVCCHNATLILFVTLIKLIRQIKYRFGITMIRYLAF